MGQEFTRNIFTFPKLSGIGSICLLEDFEGNLSVGNSGVGSYTVEHSAGSPISGSQSLNTITQPTSPVTTDYVEITKGVPLTPARLIKFSFIAVLSSSYPTGDLFFSFHYSFGALKYLYKIKRQLSDDKWYYLNSGDTYTEIEASSTPLTSKTDYLISLTVDIMSLKYVSLNINNLQFSLANIPCNISAVSAVIESFIAIRHYCSVNGTKSRLIIDNMLVESLHNQ